MLYQLLNWVNQIAFFGIQPEEPYMVRFRKRALNRTFFIIALTATVFILEGFVTSRRSITFIPAFFVLVSLIMLLLNYYNRFKISCFVLSFVFPVLFLGAIILYGEKLKLDYTISFFIVLVLTLYDKAWIRVVNLLFLIVLQGFSLYYTSNYDSVFAEYVDSFDSLLVLLATTLGLLILVFQFIRGSKDFHLQQLELNQDLDKKNRALLEIITEKETLNQKLREKTDDLQRANDFLESYTYITSHDLKTPIRNISSFSELLQKKLDMTDNQDVKDYLGFIRQGALQINGILDGIIENAQSNRSSLQLEYFDCQILIKKISQKLNTYLEEIDGEISFLELPSVCADRMMIHKVFYNLIHNGLKYSNASCPRVKITHRYTDHMHEFSVSDNGIGVQPQFEEDIFKMFKKLHSSGEFTGSGVGLALCRKIVELHGGKIWLAHSDENGSTFTFTLPSSPEHT